MTISIITYYLVGSPNMVGRTFLDEEKAIAAAKYLVESTLGNLVIENRLFWVDEEGNQVRILTRSLEK